MHPIFRNAKRFGLYLLAWVLPGALLVCVLGFSGGISWEEAVALSSPLALLYAIICLSPWYLCRVLPLREPGLWKAILHHVAASFVAAVIWTRAAWFFGSLLSSAFPGLIQRLQPRLPLLFAMGELLYTLAVALHYVYITIESSREAMRREQEARVLAREAELKALKAQINPHFLFNCLHSISALTSIDAGQAREMCLRLSDFLRNTLRLAEKESIPFGEELMLVNTYLAVEQVRFGARLQVERSVEITCERCAVPPLLLQPLIENSVKHGIASLVDGGIIRIHASCADGQLRVMVENDFDPESPAPRKTGLGLANVRSRVAARHGQKGSVDITVGESRHRVDILLPCEGIP